MKKSHHSVLVIAHRWPNISHLTLLSYMQICPTVLRPLQTHARVSMGRGLSRQLDRVLLRPPREREAGGAQDFAE